MNVPDQLRYSSDHEWLSRDGSRVRIGITDYAQDSLGDVVFVQLPALGETFNAGDTIGEVESTKSVSDIYAPVSGSVIAVNDALVDSPQLLNEEPYGDGWICELELADASQVDFMLDAAAYRGLVEG
jgi:glycine cleavage system H protein